VGYWCGDDLDTGQCVCYDVILAGSQQSDYISGQVGTENMASCFCGFSII
jgi:hypothetical protein